MNMWKKFQADKRTFQSSSTVVTKYCHFQSYNSTIQTPQGLPFLPVFRKSLEFDTRETVALRQTDLSIIL
ncbi:MAG: hypothetical protein WCD19_04510, partial [Nitrososphaeraceae archaeon]